MIKYHQKEDREISKREQNINPAESDTKQERKKFIKERKRPGTQDPGSRLNCGESCGLLQKWWWKSLHPTNQLSWLLLSEVPRCSLSTVQLSV
ncbi:hypothetical protein AV530_005062 [Patagioenas fasciata monilis]|uniref:Uncharacterized protein n=1 Tax=Patagioenas fasciata monilis TaxID=372326 RepID=A0A1V4K3Y5_PATFA|nr:hypothetical protein AV530_005062 [Patagioenas fasciata monilis]